MNEYSLAKVQLYLFVRLQRYILFPTPPTKNKKKMCYNKKTTPRG